MNKSNLKRGKQKSVLLLILTNSKMGNYFTGKSRHLRFTIHIVFDNVNENIPYS